jgi:hypothetical protein
VVSVDALDPDAIAAGLETAIARREELSALGLERSRDFAWVEVGRRTIDVYRSVVQ